MTLDGDTYMVAQMSQSLHETDTSRRAIGRPEPVSVPAISVLPHATHLDSCDCKLWTYMRTFWSVLVNFAQVRVNMVSLQIECMNTQVFATRGNDKYKAKFPQSFSLPGLTFLIWITL